MIKKIITGLLFIFFVHTSFSQGKSVRILVFSKTEGYHHASISNGIKMINELAQDNNWKVTCTDDESLFNPSILSKTDVVIFLNPTKEVLNEKERKAFRKFIESGRGFVGIHAATDCEYNCPWYDAMIGTHFRTHPPTQKGTVIIEDTNHPSMKPFIGKDTISFVDEWYSFVESPRAKVHVLASLNENSLRKSQTGDQAWRMGDHPIIWYQEYKGARSFYSVFGHTAEAFDNPLIREHFANAINWAAKRID